MSSKKSKTLRQTPASPNADTVKGFSTVPPAPKRTSIPPAVPRPTPATPKRSNTIPIPDSPASQREGARPLAELLARENEKNEEKSSGREKPIVKPASVRPAQPKPRVGFIGLGAMGRPMASRLIELGFSVRVFNRTTSVAKTLAGALPCTSPAECARGSDIIVTMLSDAASLQAVLSGPDGIIAGVMGEKRAHRPVLIDMSTIGRAAAVAIGKRVEENGLRFVDAPVSGSVKPAGKGELVALVGGSVRAVERVRPVLEALCRKMIHAGPVGQGQALKVVLNGIGAHHLVGFTSMIALGERAGLARDVLLEAFTTGSFATPSYIGKRNKLLARDYAPEFSLALALKDVALNVALQHECNVKLPVLRAIVSDLERGVANGLGELDLFALEKQYE